MSEEGPSSAELLNTFLADWLAQAPPLLATVARYAAIPHRFDLEFLDGLLPPEQPAALRESLPDLLARLKRLGFLAGGEAAEADAIYTLQPDIRRLLVERWQAEEPAAYREAHARAAAYLRTRGEDQALEIAYHLLGTGGAEALPAVTSLFERGWARRQLALLERLLVYAREQAPLLDPGDRLWLDYYQARLDGAYGRPGQAETLLRRLLESAASDELRAQVWLSLGEKLAADLNMAGALAAYDTALDLFRQQGATAGTARALAGQGMAFVHLASSLGGVEGQRGRLARWWERLAQAPFLFYRFLSRRVSWLPAVYHGTDYQDWIIVRLLFQAAALFEQALTALSTVSVSTAEEELMALDLRIRLADLRHQLEQWTAAERLFPGLVRATAGDPYRRASLDLARGRAAVARAAYERARAPLEAAAAVFARYGDHSALAQSTELIGVAHEAGGDLPAAVAAYDRSRQQARAAGDLLAATRLDARIQLLAADGEARSPAGTTGAATTVEREPPGRERAYVVRSLDYLHYFRRLALAAFALTYFFTLLLTFQLGQLVLAAEVVLARIASDTPLPLDLMLSVLLVAALPLLTVWVYYLLYVVAGLIFVHRLPLPILVRHQAMYVVTRPEEIAVRHEDGRVDRIAWAAVDTAGIDNWALGKAPLSLFSQFWLRAGGNAVTVEGIVTHFRLLQQEIGERLRDRVRRLDFSLLRSRWTAVAAGLGLLLTWVTLVDLLGAEPREPNIASITLDDGTRYLLPFTSAVWEFLRWTLLLMSLITPARLLLRRERPLPRGMRIALLVVVVIVLLVFVAEIESLTR